MSKRAFDLTLAVVGLLLTWPVFVIVGLLIKLDSSGPVFFRQERIGRGGRPFRIFKFRTMVNHAYSLGPRLTQKRDPRITRVGLILRWLKLDELPQLLNVVVGDMSLVGPRPEDPHFVGLYRPEQRLVLDVRPGLVGPSQILGRDELELYPEGVDTEQYYVNHILPQKLQTDLEYVRRAGLWYDLRLLAHGLAVTIVGSVKPKYFRLNRQKISLLVVDTVLSLAIYWWAFAIKFDWVLTEAALPYLALASGLIVLIRPACFAYFGLYQNILKYLETSEFVGVVKAVTLGSIFITVLLFMSGFGSHSRAVLVIDWMLLVVILYGYRLFLKARAERQAQPRTPALIVGANDTGEELARQLIRNHALPYMPVGFLDDDLRKQGAIIRGVKVIGTLRDLAQVARLKGARMVLIPHEQTNGDVQEVVERCRAERLDFRVLPPLDQLLNGVAEAATPVVSHPSAEAGASSAAPGNGHDAGEAGPLTAPRRPSTLLVTGGAGYIGSWLVRKLLERDYHVRVLDNFTYGDHGLRGLAGHSRLEVVEGDIRHLGSMNRAAKGVDGVIALAALVGDAACDLDPDETIATNFESVRVLADVCRRQGVARLVFASSCSVYGANSDLILNEGSWLKPVSLYARTRIQAEDALLQYAEHLSVVVLRLATVFGLSPRMRFDLLVNTLTLHAVLNRRMVVFGGDQWRPHLHVQDAADAFIVALEAPAEKVDKGVFNIGANENNHTILEVANLVKAHVPGAELEIRGDVTDPRDYRVAFDKIRSVLGFQPRFGVVEGIREIERALDSGNIPDPFADVYHNYRYLKEHVSTAERGRLVPAGMLAAPVRA
jgi:lipopolysaccharide/colanic/teichoic acid biosynthesis glycosyltransferase/nucleoside-diphosphate-sugar epimerase